LNAFLRSDSFARLLSLRFNLAMPTYEYRCPKGHDFEHFFRKISDATGEMHCPTCGAVAMRLMSAGAGLLFKGSGFYITDYGKDGKKAQPTGPKSTESKGGDGGSEAKGASESKGSSESKGGGDSAPAAKPAESAPKPSPKTESKPAPKSDTK
jgi:putative FmdB family regulatory protein